MQKNWIWIAVAVIVVGLLGYFLFAMGGASSLSSLGNTSLRSLLTSNATQTCTFTNSQTSGTIYVSAGRMRGDFSSKTGETTAQSHMIISNNIAYVWVDGLAQGYRMPFEDLSASSSNKANGGVDADAKVATNCGPWAANDSVFVLPSDISFNPIGAPAGDMAPTSSNTSGQTSGSANVSGSASGSATQSYLAQQCAACNAITDKTARMQCVAHFDCPANN